MTIFEPIKETDMTQEIEILQFLHYNQSVTRADIEAALTNPPSQATLKRLIAEMVKHGNIEVVGRGPATRYRLTPQAHVTMELNIDTYFDKDIDERQVQKSFNFELINDILPSVELFSTQELNRLSEAQEQFRKHLSEMSEIEYRKEMERLGIDLSWKSSQIEGNTYSLLETERLLKEKQTASGKTKEEAVMLLNHKDALDFILDVPEYLKDLTVGRIEEIHALLTKELGVERNIRHRRVGITGTNYTPLDNEFQIREALEDSVRLINGKSNIFDKALLALILLSYIQAFTDGNKRTARIVSNGILIANGYCPISFRTVDSVDYKKAMLIFYEQNNIAAFKRIFIDQFLFAVKTYF
jgi:Fic family protein